MRNSGSAYEEELSNQLKRREVFYSLIQIVKDPYMPELEGRIKIFKYGITIKNKIDAELKVDEDLDTDEKVEPTVIWDLFEGKNFELNIKTKSGFNNYDDSKFKVGRSTIVIDGEKMANNPTDQTKIMNYLKTAPDIHQFAFKPWDDDTRSIVETVLRKYKSPGASLDSISATINKGTKKNVVDEDSSNEIASKQTKTTKVASEDLSSFLSEMNV